MQDEKSSISLPEAGLSLAFAVHLLFGALAVLNLSDISYFYYYSRSFDVVLVGAAADRFVWFASVAGIIVLLWFARIRSRKFLFGSSIVLAVLLVSMLTSGSNAVLVLVYFMGCLCLGVALRFSESAFRRVLGPLCAAVLISFIASVEFSSAIHYGVIAFDPHSSLGTFDAQIELSISYVASAIVPLLFVVFLVTCLWAPLSYVLLRSKFGRHRHTDWLGVREHGGSNSNFFHQIGTSLLEPKFLALLSLGCFIGFYPYLHVPPWLVGVDAYWRYFDPVTEMESLGFYRAFQFALRQWHPFIVLLYYVIYRISGATPYEMILFTPLVLTLAFAAVNWWFQSGSSTTFGFVVFFTSLTSVTVTVGMWASILASWLALVVCVASLGYVVYRAGVGFRIFDFVMLLCFSLLVLLIHPWTWGFYAFSILVVAGSALVLDRRRGIRPALLLLLVLFYDGLAAFLSLRLRPATEGAGVANAFQIYFQAVERASLPTFVTSLTRLTQVWAAFFSPVLICLGIIGALLLPWSAMSGWRQRIILTWIFTAAVGCYFAAPVGFDPSQPFQSESEMWRIFFLAPLQFTAPIGIVAIASLPRKFLAPVHGYSQPDAHNSSTYLWIGPVVSGLFLSLTQGSARIIPLLLAPIIILLLLRNQRRRVEGQDLSSLIMGLLFLMLFNYAARALSQLLIDPHNYRP